MLRMPRHVLAGALLAVVTGCGGEPAKPPAVATVTVAPGSATLIVGNNVVLAATTADSRGAALTGRTITWSSDQPAVASVGTGGTVTGIAPGVATIRATSEGKAGTAAITVVPPPVALVLVEAQQTFVRVGQQLSLKVTLLDANGNRLTDRAVSWKSSAPTNATVDNAGIVTGVAAGFAIIEASSEGQAGTFSLTVRPSNVTLVIDGVTPAALQPGSAAEIQGGGFEEADQIRVSVGGAAAPILSASPDRLTVLVPCVRGPSADVRLTLDTQSVARTLPIGTTARSLAVGQSFITTDAASSGCNELVAPAGPARYLVAVFSSATSANTVTAFAMQGNPPAGGSVAAQAVAPRVAQLSGRATSAPDDDAHYAFLERDRLRYEELRRRAAPPQIPTLRRTAAPAVGDMRTAFYTFSTGCQDTTQMIRARAVHVGPRSVVWEDSANTLQSSVDSALAGYYRRLGQQFDAEQYDIIRRNFGDPLLRDGQTDGDGLIHMIFSQRLNGTGAAAFVTSCDQFPRTTARASNVGEIFYGAVPTATGSNLGSTNFPDGWFAFMGRTVVHEVKHIASLAARVSNSSPSFEQSWLEEGTARHAEEVWVREHMHRIPWKGNTGYGTAQSNGIYCDFHPADPACTAADPLHRPSLGMRRHFNEIREKLIEPWNWSPYGTAQGQSGSVFYQTTWSLVRYAIDRYAPSDDVFFSRLTSSREVGVANLSSVLDVPMDRLIGGWGLALYADDYPGVANLDPDVRFPTWNLRDIYRGLNQSTTWSTRWSSTFPILPQPLAFGSFTATQSGLRGGAHTYFELAGTTGGSQLIGLQGAGGVAGTPMPSTLRVAVVRLQ